MQYGNGETVGKGATMLVQSRRLSDAGIRRTALPAARDASAFSHGRVMTDIRRPFVAAFDGTGTVRRLLAPVAMLDPGWDSYGGAAIDEMVLNRAEAFLVPLADAGDPLPRVFPTAQGGLELEWRRPEHELSLEFKPVLGFQSPGVTVYARDEAKDEEWEGEIATADPAQLQAWFDRAIGRRE
jgi:hypothetical protein